jgi:2-oxoisovalerate dehydrogenase E2 component (dihydrolipoyl transacylase)
MSTYSFKLPDVGEGIAEAEIVAWHVKVGDIVEEDAPLADVMTNKATIEIASPVAGKVVSLAGEVGEQIAIGSSLTVFELPGGKPQRSEVDGPEETFQPAQAGRSSEAPVGRSLEEPSPGVGEQQVTRPGVAGAVQSPRRKVLASPAVRDRARALGVDLEEVEGAVDGRVRHADLDQFLSYNSAGGYRPASVRRRDEEVKVFGLRRRIAENMSASKRTIPHFTYVEEIDVTKLEELRADLNATRGAKPKLTMLPLLITAVCKALPEFPMINAHYDAENETVTRFGSVHFGIATQTDAGLMVPVVRDAQDRNLWQLAAEIVRLAEATRSGKAKSEELSGSTLTITSLGKLGGIATTPVINRPEVAIIGPNKVVERPVFRDGQVVAAKLMNLSISCDHRVVDGWDAASFVQELKRLVETPALLFSI